MYCFLNRIFKPWYSFRADIIPGQGDRNCSVEYGSETLEETHELVPE